jgi:tRNA(Ile)-lysidine synthase
VKSEDHRNTLLKVRATIETYSMIEPGSRVLVAVSGGADSVALLHILSELRKPLGFELAVAHLNHSLREEDSDADQAFVEELAGDLGLECFSGKADVRGLSRREKLSLEEAGRAERRKFLLRAASEGGCGPVATGHHGDDQAETVLLRLIRGAGVRGLAGIEPVAGDRFVRPLIECERAELRAYLEERHLRFREDESNLDRAFLRNRIRHDLLPVLERDFNPSIAKVLRRTSANMADVERLLNSLGSKLLQEARIDADQDTLSLDSRRLRAYDKAAWGHVFRRAYEILAGDSLSLTRAHIQALTDLVASRPSGTTIHLPGGLRAAVEYGVVSIYRHEPHPASTPSEKEVLLPGITAFPELGGSLETSLARADDLPADIGARDPAVEHFDMKSIFPPLRIRTRRRGDRIRPFGSGGTKKLKDLLIDLKIPPDRRETTPVLEDSRGLLWVVGLRRSDRAKITGNTRETLTVAWRKDN